MEYASFHYLMHKIPEQQKAYYVSGPSPLTYEELYSPRPRTLIVKKEVSYWRTRDRIEYALYEDRTHNVLIITCYSIDSKEAFRTIFVNLERLFYEVESKARDTKELLTSKSNKKLADDASLYKAVGEYILARLSIKADKLP
jgi:FMN phosphatase YigB (HAD superfamily)